MGAVADDCARLARGVGLRRRAGHRGDRRLLAGLRCRWPNLRQGFFRGRPDMYRAIHGRPDALGVRLSGWVRRALLVCSESMLVASWSAERVVHTCWAVPYFCFRYIACEIVKK